MAAGMRELRFDAGEGAGEVSALVRVPEDPRAVYVFAHGAGAGMRHAFMESVSAELAARGVATFRYQFPYVERGSRRPDPQPVLLSTVRSAIAAAASAVADVPIFAGGKSMGGRMTSNAAAVAPLPGVRGIVFLGFPLHPPKRPATTRADHLTATTVPLLFVQGTRDELAGLDLLEPIVEGLGARATLHVIQDADHGFTVRKRVTGRSGAEVLAEVADVAAKWMSERRS